MNTFKTVIILVIGILQINSSQAHWGSESLLDRVFEDPGQIIPSEICDPNSVIDEINGFVVKVSDGDTIKVDTGEAKPIAIRMLGVDTPETKYFGKSQGYWGEVASQNTAKLLPIGTRVKVMVDQTRCDSFGRVLGQVFKGTNHINREILESALAVNYCIYPDTKYCEEFGTIVRSKIQNKEGIYSDSSLILPYVWRKKINNSDMDKYAGSWVTHEVYYPNFYERIETPDRVFFLRQKDIQSPFHLVKEKDPSQQDP